MWRIRKWASKLVFQCWSTCKRLVCWTSEMISDYIPEDLHIWLRLQGCASLLSLYREQQRGYATSLLVVRAACKTSCTFQNQRLPLNNVVLIHAHEQEVKQRTDFILDVLNISLHSACIVAQVSRHWLVMKDTFSDFLCSDFLRAL